MRGSRASVGQTGIPASSETLDERDQPAPLGQLRRCKRQFRRAPCRAASRMGNAGGCPKLCARCGTYAPSRFARAPAARPPRAVGRRPWRPELVTMRSEGTAALAAPVGGFCESSVALFRLVSLLVRARPRRDTAAIASAGCHRRAYLADEFGSGGCVKRAGRHGGFEHQYVGYEHTPCACVQQLADPKARVVEDVARLLNGDGSVGVSDDGAELAVAVWL